MTYRQAVDFLNSFQNYEQTIQYRYPEAFSLDRVEKLLRRLGNPHRAYPSLHVAGTKGKGSTCAFAASILQAVGCRTGLYTSPHLFDFRERFRVNGTMISEMELAELVERIRPFAGQDLTYFEVTTACAFLYFAEQKVEAAVVEVGMGGRLDATNVLSPRVTVITPVSLDHVSKLGATVEEITAEKAGILKSGVPVVVAPQAESALRVIQGTASRLGVPVHGVEKQMNWTEVRQDLSGISASLQSPVQKYPGLHIPLLGKHQLDNAAAAIRMLELYRSGKNLDPAAVSLGIASTRWLCRFQVKETSGRAVILDGAQNEDSARALRETVDGLFPGKAIHLIAGCSTDKEIAGMVRAWRGWPESVILTRSTGGRPEPVENLRPFFGEIGCAVAFAQTVPQALDQAIAAAGPDDLVVVSGSLVVAAEASAIIASADASGAGGPGKGRRPQSLKSEG